MLVGHQALGFGLLAIDLGATIVGQLNYNDHFVSGAPTFRYQSAHRTLAWATVATFVATGALAVFAPSPPRRVSQGFDRVALHKWCMASATAAMVAQAALGMATAGREGQLNQQDLGKAHLAIGYFTFAALAIGFGALVF
jgi:cytochrome b561